MSATTTAASRLRGFTPDVQRKIIRAEARSAKRQKIERIRTGLATIIDSAERDWAARKQASCASDAEPSRTLLTAYEIAAEFDALLQELSL
jgi:hypothetical protein